MSMVGKRKHRKLSDESQPSISPDSKLTKMKGEEFNMATTSSEEEVPSLGDIWTVLIEIKENTNHLDEEFEQLKASFALQDKEISKL